ncbi:phosphatidylserine decarboxylase [Williamsia serinedens]|uniref:Phosphatidylserine decarboxylase proenzyme n=1 Tax=Williamsia serinedens TaxID=391736 RepID=A0ABT1H4J1_9NOCA|nr:phosphatidylserine decarboxylase [Williamsia serinedens]
MARRPKPTASAVPGAPAGDRGRLTRHTRGLTHVVELVGHTLPPVHPAGLPFVAAPAALALAGRNRRWIRTPALAASVACAAFFRHPDRVPPTATGAVVAPADGEITLVDVALPPPELGLGAEPLPRVSTFLSILDVHVQRSPVAGEVVSVTHTPGRFLSADLPEASAENERTCMHLRTDAGTDVGVVQIAGLLARRIVNDKRPGDRVGLGETYGLIRFGSRVDVYLPAGTQPEVLPGQRAVGAETVLARL